MLKNESGRSHNVGGNKWLIILMTVFSFSATAADKSAPAQQTAVFAGGCFWGVDAVFKHVKGVTDVVSGYSGGAAATAHYEMVSEGDYRACRIGARPFRSGAGFLSAIAAGVFQRGARSHPAQPPGSGYRQPIPLGDLLHQRGAAARSRKITSGNLPPRALFPRPSSRKSCRCSSSIRPRSITRTIWHCILTSPISFSTICPSWNICASNSPRCTNSFP